MEPNAALPELSTKGCLIWVCGEVCWNECEVINAAGSHLQVVPEFVSQPELLGELVLVQTLQR